MPGERSLEKLKRSGCLGAQQGRAEGEDGNDRKEAKHGGQAHGTDTRGGGERVHWSAPSFRYLPNSLPSTPTATTLSNACASSSIDW